MDTLSNRLPHVFSWLYVHNSSESKARDHVKSIVDTMVKQLSNRITTTQWMDSPTRKAALIKLEKLITLIGWQDWVLDCDKFREMHSHIRINPSSSFFGTLLEIDKSLTHEELRTLYRPQKRNDM